MYIKKIEFTNFRGFQELSVDLPENLAVFIGVNGSGKTTILDGIYKFILAYIYELNCAINENYDFGLNFLIDETDLFQNQNTGEFIIKIIGSNNTNGNRSDDIILGLSLNKNEFKQEPSDFQKSQISLAKKIRENPSTSLSVMAYYQSSLLKIDESHIKDNDNMTKGFKIKQMFAYENLVMLKFSDYHNFISWFRDQEDKENEEIRARKDFEYRNRNLEIIRQSLLKFLSFLGSNNFENLRIIRKNYYLYDQLQLKLPISNQNQLTISKNDTDLNISQLSDGEKKCILIVADIAKRLAIANPGLEISNVLEKGKGIILIDEIEAHLHPGWQRKIIPALTKTFPSCQFIVTTHSPQVLSKVNSENIFILEDGMVINAKDAGYHTYGRTSNSILSELFDIRERPQEFKDRINNLYQTIIRKKDKKVITDSSF
ncbi:MAG: AAA family ATPase [Crocosphaera sp.]|nr:AAA family ATPase [Crocosphaera sp.]